MSTHLFIYIYIYIYINEICIYIGGGARNLAELGLAAAGRRALLGRAVLEAERAVDHAVVRRNPLHP